MPELYHLTLTRVEVKALQAIAEVYTQQMCDVLHEYLKSYSLLDINCALPDLIRDVPVLVKIGELTKGEE